MLVREHDVVEPSPPSGLPAASAISSSFVVSMMNTPPGLNARHTAVEKARSPGSSRKPKLPPKQIAASK